MKKKLRDRRGAAIELAIMMMVFSIFITTIILTTALLQNEHKTKAQLGIEQDIFLEQLGEDFMNVVCRSEKKMEDWKPSYKGRELDRTIEGSPDGGNCVKYILKVESFGRDNYVLHIEIKAEELTEIPTEEPTEVSTEEPTEASTEEPTEEPTEGPTEEPTEGPTEEPTEGPTEEPTEGPTEESTEVSVEERGDIVLQITISQIEGIYKITEWSKK